MEKIETATARFGEIIGLTNTKTGTRLCRIWMQTGRNDSFSFNAFFADTANSRYHARCTVDIENSRVELHDIDTPKKSGLGAVLMWLVCEYAVGRRLLVFYVKSGISLFWEKGRPRGLAERGSDLQ